MFKKFALYLLFFLFILAKNSSAFTPDTFLTISNPVRGLDGWTNTKQTPLDLPIYQYQEATPSALPITWMMRYDALSDATISAYFNQLIIKDSTQHLGAFLEITQSLTNKADVKYPDGHSIFNANRIFLSGYSQQDRIKIIDTYMDGFFQKFGFYPQSIAAWHLDSFSLQYMQSKYSVLTAMNCDDQYSMDHYQLWGGYLGSPYFPDKNNSLIPANRSENRINLAMVRWAQRDLDNFYGSGIASLYSVQLNDYLSLGKDTNYLNSIFGQYAQKNLNEFTYINLGLENDYDLKRYASEIKNVYSLIDTTKNKYRLRTTDLASFGDWFKARYPESSPAYAYKTENTFWYQSPNYRIGIKTENGKSQIIDLRVYNRDIYEEYFATANTSTSLSQEIPAIIDTVKYPNTVLSLPENISHYLVEHNKNLGLWQISLWFKDKKIIFSSDAITFENLELPPLNDPSLQVTNSDSKTIWHFTTATPYKQKLNFSVILWLSIISGLLLILFRKVSRLYFVGLVLSLICAITLFRQYSTNSFGFGFWGPNGHDAIFHLSLINHFSQNPLSLNNSSFNGYKLHDYHFLFDYVSGLMVRLTGVSSTTYYFVIFPIISSIVLVFYLEKLMKKWGYNPLQQILGYILVFFAGSFGFIARIIQSQELFSGESAFWINQSASMFLNPPFVLSLTVLLIFLIKYDEKKNTMSDIIALSILGGLLAQTKVYAFILLVGALFIRKDFRTLFGVVFVGALISLPFASFSGSPFVFQPLWFTKTIFSSFDRVYWPKFANAWQVYETTGNLPKLLIVNTVALMSYFFGNLGGRVFGFFATNKQGSISWQLVKMMIALGIITPLVITQTKNPWNTIQFSYYSLFFLGLFTAQFAVAWFQPKTFIKKLLLIIFIFLSTLTSIATLKDYFSITSASRISYLELLSLEKLAKSERGVVISPIFVSAVSPTPKTQYTYVTSSYISAFSGQPEFLADTINLSIMGVEYQSRLQNVQKFYNTTDKDWAKQFLQDNQIRYVYETPLKHLTLNPADLDLVPLYLSSEVNVFVSRSVK